MTIVMAGICFLLAATAAYGQEKDFYDNYLATRSKGIARGFAQKYRLDKAGQEQVEKTFTAYYRAVDALRNSPGNKPQKDASYREIVRNRDNALKGILPPNQWKKYESDMAGRASDSLAIYHQRETLQKQ